MSLTKEDLQAIGALLEPMKTDIDELKEGLQAVRTSQLKVELEQYPQITAALDGAIGGIEKNAAQDERLAALEEKTDNHGIRLLALEQKAI